MYAKAEIYNKTTLKKYFCLKWNKKRNNEIHNTTQYQYKS